MVFFFVYMCAFSRVSTSCARPLHFRPLLRGDFARYSALLLRNGRHAESARDGRSGPANSVGKFGHHAIPFEEPFYRRQVLNKARLCVMVYDISHASSLFLRKDMIILYPDEKKTCLCSRFVAHGSHIQGVW